MAQSLSLFSAQVQFLNDGLALIHIPLNIYPFFLQPILRLIFHDVPPIEDTEPDEDVRDLDFPESARPAFLNISITPVECSIVCSRELAELYIRPLAERINKNENSKTNHVSISKEDFIAMQVDGQGLDAGQRVLELTSPLAMAGVSIFFISTYFSDYILVPRRSRGHVTQALETRGFTFEVSSDAFVTNNPNPQYRSSPPTLNAQRSPPSTPPPSTLSELQTRTFASLRKHNIHARVDPSLRIVQCAAQYSTAVTPSTPSPSASLLRPSLVTTLILDNPRFLSLTLTATDPAASILLEKRLLPRFSLDHYPSTSDDSSNNNNLLLGSKDDVLIPIMLDLRDLPLEATGIVCGVASRLAAATQSREATNSSESENGGDDDDDYEVSSSSVELSLNGAVISKSHKKKKKPPSLRKQMQEQRQLYGGGLPADPGAGAYTDTVDISFLSTARAGTVIVGERELERAMASLEVESGER
ncbi:hypothetical protein AJ79_04616 [Helicocarpus griseus UAMH5409]|uniref:CASTOR ACT domain-containing protein n=1 Tax=Helicocarpus griseus UAMH5409 TaxID=1447875 RepID=A0A2B7XJL3_9EURO|nr:hypothetical protein AJ79_04616 [Helicocarpus griseus UAMH5409]